MNTKPLFFLAILCCYLHAFHAFASTTDLYYDSLNRLTLVKYDESNMVHYTYDAAGNRTKMIRIGPDNPDLDSDGDGVADREELLECGDLDSNTMAEPSLDQAIRALRVAAGEPADHAGIPDIDKDGRIGPAEAVWVLQILADMREFMTPGK